MSTSLEALSISSDGDGVGEMSPVRPKLLNRFDNQLQIELPESKSASTDVSRQGRTHEFSK
jgi:hypothetical protein